MIDFFKNLPHLEAYGNPQYFFYIILAVLPIFIGLFFNARHYNTSQKGIDK